MSCGIFAPEVSGGMFALKRSCGIFASGCPVVYLSQVSARIFAEFRRREAHEIIKQKTQEVDEIIKEMTISQGNDN